MEWISRKQFAAISSAALSTVLLHLSHAGASVWDGSTANWSNAAHWSGNLVPGASSAVDAQVDSGTINVDNDYILRDLSFAGDQLGGTHVLTVNSDFTWTGGTLGCGVTVGSAGAASLSGNLFNSGSLNIAAGAALTTADATTLTNSGTVALGGGNLSLRNGSTTTGRYTAAAGTAITFGRTPASTNILHEFNGGQLASGGGVTLDNAHLYLHNGSTISAATINLTGVLSNLTGDGTFTGVTTIDETTVQPGNLAGDTAAFRINGDAALTSGTVLDFDLDPLASPPIDQLSGSGALALDNPFLIVTAADPSTISALGRYVVLHTDESAGRTGTLDPASLDADGRLPVYDSMSNVVGSFAVQYTGQEVALVNYVPEPASVVCAALLGVAPLLRKRRRLS